MPPPRSRVMTLPPIPARSALQLVFSAEFGSALAGKMLMNTAFWAQTMLFVVLTYELTGSAAWVGAVTAAQVIPQLFLALASGSMADRRGPQIPVVSGGVCAGVGCIGLAIWLQLPPGDRDIPAQWPIMLAALVSGVGIALASSAMQAVPPRLSEVNEHATAMSLNFLPSALARTLGPVAGSFLGTALGPVTTLGIIGISSLVAASVFLFIRRLATPEGTAVSRRGLRPVFRHVWRDKSLLAVLGAVAAIGAGAEAAITLAPSIGQLLRIGASGAGWVTGAFGLGGLVGVVTFRLCGRFMGPAAIGCLSMMALAGSMILVALVPTLPFATVMLVVGGASMVMGITAFSVLGQQLSPAEFLGRVMALWVMAFAGVRPVAGLTLGFVSDHFSTAVSVAGAGVFTAVTTCGVYYYVRERPQMAAKRESRVKHLFRRGQPPASPAKGNNEDP